MQAIDSDYSAHETKPPTPLGNQASTTRSPDTSLNEQSRLASLSQTNPNCISFGCKQQASEVEVTNSGLRPVLRDYSFELQNQGIIQVWHAKQTSGRS